MVISLDYFFPSSVQTDTQQYYHLITHHLDFLSFCIFYVSTTLLWLQCNIYSTSKLHTDKQNEAIFCIIQIWKVNWLSASFLFDLMLRVFLLWSPQVDCSNFLSVKVSDTFIQKIIALFSLYLYHFPLLILQNTLLQKKKVIEIFIAMWRYKFNFFIFQFFYTFQNNCSHKKIGFSSCSFFSL